MTAPLGWNVTAVFSDDLTNTVITGADWEIRTSGTNCVGTPCGNDMNAFFNSTEFGVFFQGQPYDYSNGVIGTAVPEPITWTMMALGAVVLIGVQRLRRSGKKAL